jgi:hypothetical protein
MGTRTALVAGVLLISIPGSLAAEPFRFPEARDGNAVLRYIRGIPVLWVSGTPEDIGKAAGVLALKPGHRMANYPDDLLAALWLRPLRRPMLYFGRRMLQQVSADHRTELAAMYRAAGIDDDRAVLNNTFFDLKKTVLCSALLVDGARSDTGGPLLSRNLEYPLLGYAHQYGLVTVYRPARTKHAFATIGFPGMIGCLSGMNDAGLAVAVMEAYQTKPYYRRCDLTGTPFAICYRRLLEDCATVSEAYAALKQMRRTGLHSLAVADRQSVAVFEITPDHVVLRRPENGVCICTNHFRSPALRPFVTLNLFHSIPHYAELARRARTAASLYVPYLQQSLNAVCDQDMTMQTMVFEPRTLRLHLSIGTVPASAQEFSVLELSPFLRAGESVSRPCEMRRLKATATHEATR